MEVWLVGYLSFIFTFKPLLKPWGAMQLQVQVLHVSFENGEMSKKAADNLFRIALKKNSSTITHEKTVQDPKCTYLTFFSRKAK